MKAIICMLMLLECRLKIGYSGSFVLCVMNSVVCIRRWVDSKLQEFIGLYALSDIRYTIVAAVQDTLA